MQRVSELIGKPIVSAESGENVGSAADLLMNNTGDHLVGIVIAGGVFSGERVLPYEDVHTFGPDAIVARSQRGVVDAREWHQRGVESSRSSSLKNKTIITNDGRRLGAVKDVLIEERTGEVHGYDVGDRLFGGLVSRHRVLPRTGDVMLGPDVIVVSGEAADRLETDDDTGLEHGRGDANR